MTKRIGYIDAFRGMGIILMIMGHAEFVGAFEHFIHAFHMPMFYFVSGLFFYSEGCTGLGLVTFIKKKARTLLVPYAFFGLVNFIRYAFMYKETFTLNPLQHLLFENTSGLPIAGALWFLTSLFFTEVIYYLLVWLIKNRIVLHSVIILLALFGNFETIILSVRLPYAIGPALVGLGLFHIAHILKQYKDIFGKKFNLSLWTKIIIAVILCVLVFVNGYINMRAGIYSIVPLFWVNAIGISAIGLDLVKDLDIKYGENMILRGVKYIGRNSIVYVSLNQLIINDVYWKLYGSAVPEYLKKYIMLIAAIIGLTVINAVMLKTPLKKVIGK